MPFHHSHIFLNGVCRGNFTFYSKQHPFLSLQLYCWSSFFAMKTSDQLIDIWMCENHSSEGETGIAKSCAVVTRLQDGWPKRTRGSVSGTGKSLFCFCLSLFSLSRLASTHPPMQSVLGLFSLGVNWPGHEVHLSVLLRLTMPGAIPPLPHMPSWQSTELISGTIGPHYLMLMKLEIFYCDST